MMTSSNRWDLFLSDGHSRVAQKKSSIKFSICTSCRCSGRAQTMLTVSIIVSNNHYHLHLQEPFRKFTSLDVSEPSRCTLLTGPSTLARSILFRVRRCKKETFAPSSLVSWPQLMWLPSVPCFQECDKRTSFSFLDLAFATADRVHPTTSFSRSTVGVPQLPGRWNRVSESANTYSIRF